MTTELVDKQDGGITVYEMSKINCLNSSFVYEIPSSVFIVIIIGKNDNGCLSSVHNFF